MSNKSPITPAQRKQAQRQRAARWLAKFGLVTAEALVTKMMKLPADKQKIIAELIKSG